MLFPDDWNLTISSIVCFRNQVISLLLLVKQPSRQKAWWLSLEHVFSYSFLSSFLFHLSTDCPICWETMLLLYFNFLEWVIVSDLINEVFFFLSCPVAVAYILSNWQTNKLVIIHSIFSTKFGCDRMSQNNPAVLN